MTRPAGRATLAVLSLALAPWTRGAARPEGEPNGSAAVANVLDFGSAPAAAVRGAVPLADNDYTALYAPKIYVVWAATDTGGLQNPGANERDTVLDLLDSDGTSVIESDDDDGFGNGADGTLESGLASLIAGRGVYPGQKYLRVRAFDPAEDVVDPYTLTVVLTDPTLDGAEAEPNDTAASANFLFAGPPNVAVRYGAIDAPGDVDTYAVVAHAGQTLFFAADCDPDRVGGGTDLVLELQDSTDTVLLHVDSSLDEPSAAEGARFTVTANGLYYVRVQHFESTGTGAYNLMVANVDGPRVKGDLDRNQQTDLLLRRTTTGQNDVWLMNGVSRADLVTLPDAPASLDWSIVGTDDFNGDQRDDLVLWNSSTGAVEVWLMNGTTRVGAPVSITGAPVMAAVWKPSATGDFNADGHPDVVWRNVVTQKIAIWTLNGLAKTGDIVPSPDQAVDVNWEIVAALDYNGDGLRDFLWYNSTSGNIVQWLMNASVVRTTGRFTTPTSAGDSNWKVLASGDYGVGPGGAPNTNDVVWRNATSGNVVVWYLDTAAVRTAGTFTTPTAPASPATDWTIVGPR